MKQVKPCRETLHFHRTLAATNRRSVQRARLDGREDQRGIFGHNHDDTDDFFMVLSGRLRLELRDGTVSLGSGEVFVVPMKIKHRPVTEEDRHILLIERQGTLNTGDRATAAVRRAI